LIYYLFDLLIWFIIIFYLCIVKNCAHKKDKSFSSRQSFY
jgi:hypothetical protein